MSHVRSLHFEALEARRLLTKAHIVAAHAAAAAVAAPLVLNGTLTVDNSAATTTMNANSTSTTSTPVVGQLGSLGKVRGVWNETADAFGNHTGLDTLRLHDAKGGLIIIFDNETSVNARPYAHGDVYYQHGQRLYDATGAYAGATESGSIDLITNKAKTHVVSLALDTWKT